MDKLLYAVWPIALKKDCTLLGIALGAAILLQFLDGDLFAHRRTIRPGASHGIVSIGNRDNLGKDVAVVPFYLVGLTLAVSAWNL